jgi:hypothetical protein
LLTHFPIVLFLLLPLLLILAGVSRKNTNHAFLGATLVVMLVATTFLYLTYSTGIARAAAFQGHLAAGPAIAHHRALAGYALSAFAVATGLFAVALLVRRKLKLDDMRDLTPWIPVGFFVFYILGVFWLVLTAHEGAMLSHTLLPGHAVQ